jgi:hypothetical protein
MSRSSTSPLAFAVAIDPAGGNVGLGGFAGSVDSSDGKKHASYDAEQPDAVLVKLAP